MEAGTFRVAVSLARYFSDERARCYMAVDGSRRAGWLSRRLRRTFALPCRPALLTRGHLLPPGEPLSLLRPDDTVEAIPSIACIADLSRQRVSGEVVSRQRASDDQSCQRTSDEDLTRQRASDEDQSRQRASDDAQSCQRTSDEDLSCQRASDEDLSRQRASDEDLSCQRASDEDLSRQRASDEDRAGAKRRRRSDRVAIERPSAFRLRPSSRLLNSEMTPAPSSPVPSPVPSLGAEALQQMKRRALDLLESHEALTLAPCRRRRVRRRRRNPAPAPAPPPAAAPAPPPAPAPAPPPAPACTVPQDEAARLEVGQVNHEATAGEEVNVNVLTDVVMEVSGVEEEVEEEEEEEVVRNECTRQRAARLVRAVR